jgi:WD40 repeat protein
MHRIAGIFDSPGWKEILDQRRESMLGTLQLYELIFGSDPVHKDPTDPAERDPISIIVDDEHDLLIDERRQRQQEFPFSASFNGSVILLADPEVIPLPHENLKSLAVVPQNHQSIVVLADNRLISVSLKSPVTCRDLGRRLEHEVISIEAHPHCDLFVAVSTNGPLLFDLQKGFLDYWFTLSSKEKVNCAAFSARNLKLAVCSNVIDVFILDFAKTTYEPSTTREINQPITAVAWVNTDTVLAVAYAQENQGCLVIVDTLVKYDTPVEVKREWGLITGINVEPRRGKLVFVTQKGVTVVCDMTKNYRHDCIHVHGSPVTAMSSLNGVFVVATENGTLVTLCASDNEKRLEKIPNRARIRAVCMVDDMMAAVGDKRLVVWRMRN